MQNGCTVPILLLAFCLAAGGALASAADTQYSPVHLAVNGKPADFTSQIMGEAMPAMMVQGHAMLPVRFFEEILGVHVDLHLECWKIVSLTRGIEGPWSFKIGERIAYSPVASIGGDQATDCPLPIAPRIIRGRLYLPARTVLTLFKAAAAWNGATHTLAIASPPLKQGTRGY